MPQLLQGLVGAVPAGTGNSQAPGPGQEPQPPTPQVPPTWWLGDRARWTPPGDPDPQMLGMLGSAAGQLGGDRAAHQLGRSALATEYLQGLINLGKVRLDANGDLWADDVSPEEDRQVQRALHTIWRTPGHDDEESPTRLQPKGDE